jgi:hypothetical protein
MKTKTNPRPWRLDEPWIDALCEATARLSKAAFTQLIAERDARIAQLEGDVAVLQAAIGKSMEEPK